MTDVWPDGRYDRIAVWERGALIDDCALVVDGSTLRIVTRYNDRVLDRDDGWYLVVDYGNLRPGRSFGLNGREGSEPLLFFDHFDHQALRQTLEAAGWRIIERPRYVERLWNWLRAKFGGPRPDESGTDKAAL